MGKKLAIRGHSTRGKEVIELLEMMGGKNIHKRDGEANAYSYYLYDNAILSDRLSIAEDDDFEIFTLQDFLEKFPYKVGDKVHIYVQNDDIDGRYDIEATEITSMRWNPNIRKIAYKMKNIKREFYKEEIKCKVDDSDDVHSISECKTTGQGTYAIRIADGYKFDSIDENGNIIIKSIKPKYPTTYEECYNILNDFNFPNPEKYDFEFDWRCKINDKDYGKLMQSFIKLLICHDVYWKIAGEQMGLGKPWEPDNNDVVYSIVRTKNTLCLSDALWGGNCNILEFPTKEMRDVFYENFEDLIEQCKELL